MTAEIKPRIDFEGRTKLETVIPLSTPYLVFLDPSSLCNQKCSFCPTGTGETKKHYTPGLMDFDLYMKIIDDLAAMPKPIKTLRLYKDGEPLLHPRFPDMVEYAKTTGRFGQIDTTTNGLLLDTEYIHYLRHCGLDKIFISVPQNYTKEYVSNIGYLHISSTILIYAKIIGDGLLESQKQMFLDDFSEIADRVFIENLSPCWPGYDAGEVNQEKGIYGQPLDREPLVCPYPFYSASINTDGTVSACFVDWGHKLFIGALYMQTFQEIWNGPIMRSYRLMNLHKNRLHHPICGQCGQLKYGAPDDIDQYANDILRRYDHE